MLILSFLATFTTFAMVLVLLMAPFEKKPTSVSALRLRKLTQLPVSSARNRSVWQPLRDLTVTVAEWTRSRTGLFVGEALRTQLATAGFPDSFARDVYTVARIAALPLGLACGAVLPQGRVLGMVVASAVFSMLPSACLRQLRKRRKTKIRRSMPDLVDLLVICVDAGLGLDQAMLRVSEELAVSHPTMHQALVLVGGEQRAGKPRMQAWQDMADALAIEEVEAFVSMLVQADRFGTPISRALSSFAARIRLQRTQFAEEQAAKTTVKILFPLVLFLFPTIFIVLLGPAILTMVRAFAGGLK